MRSAAKVHLGIKGRCVVKAFDTLFNKRDGSEPLRVDVFITMLYTEPHPGFQEGNSGSEEFDDANYQGRTRNPPQGAAVDA